MLIKSKNTENFDVLFDLIRSINKLAFVKKSKIVHTCRVQKYKEDIKEMNLKIHTNKIKNFTPCLDLSSL